MVNFFKVLAKYSPKNFHQLKLYGYTSHSKFEIQTEVLEALETFFTDWKNCIPQKSLIIIIITSDNYYYAGWELLEGYKKLGVVNKFEVISYYENFEEYLVEISFTLQIY